jgi:hypothetical protein
MNFSPAFTKLSNSITPAQMQDMLNTMSLYKIYTTLGVSDKLLMKYIKLYNLSFKKAFKTINDLSESEKLEIVNEWITTRTTKRSLLEKFSIGPGTLHKVLKASNVLDREKNEIDSVWQNYHSLALRLTAVTKRHYKLKSKKDFDWDHKISIRDGYLQKIPVGIIASIENLELIPVALNRSNGHLSSISKEKLFQLCNITPPRTTTKLQTQQDVVEHPFLQKIPN